MFDHHADDAHTFLLYQVPATTTAVAPGMIYDVPIL